MGDETKQPRKPPPSWKLGEGLYGHQNTKHLTSHTTRQNPLSPHTPDGSWKVDPRRFVVAAPGVGVLGLHSPRGGVVGDQGIHPSQDHVPADLVVEAEVMHADCEGCPPESSTIRGGGANRRKSKKATEVRFSSEESDPLRTRWRDTIKEERREKKQSGEGKCGTCIEHGVLSCV